MMLTAGLRLSPFSLLRRMKPFFRINTIVPYAIRVLPVACVILEIEAYLLGGVIIAASPGAIRLQGLGHFVRRVGEHVYPRSNLRRIILKNSSSSFNIFLIVSSY